MSSVEITFRGMDSSPALEQTIQRWCDRLVRVYHRIQRIGVTIEQPHRRHAHGNNFHITVEVVVPNRTLVASRDPAHDGAHEDAYVAIADAFQDVAAAYPEHADSDEIGFGATVDLTRHDRDFATLSVSVILGPAKQTDPRQGMPPLHRDSRVVPMASVTCRTTSSMARLSSMDEIGGGWQRWGGDADVPLGFISAAHEAGTATAPAADF